MHIGTGRVFSTIGGSILVGTGTAKVVEEATASDPAVSGGFFAGLGVGLVLCAFLKPYMDDTFYGSPQDN